MGHACALARAAGCLLLAAWASAAAACPGTATTALSLTLTPGEIRGIEHVLQVNVQADGCLRVRRPAHWREPGSWSGPATAPALRGLAAWPALDALAGFDGERVRAELEALESSRGQAFTVEGADHYVLRWTDDAGTAQVATFDAVFQYVERYPERADLAAFAAVVAALQDEAARDDLVALEPQP